MSLPLSWIDTLLVCAMLASASGLSGAEQPVSRIAFGSCIKQDRPQPIWEAVVATQPDLFVLLGDNIYGDTEDMDILRAKYQLLGSNAGYRKLKSVCPILATWDDHDFGVNDGGTEYPMKRESQQIFLDFFEAPATDERRSREGVYSAAVYGPPGQRVQIVLLDTRYFRSPLLKNFQPGEPGEGVRGIYSPSQDPAATILGEAQWEWLKLQLAVPAELRLIGSSIQVLPTEHGWESWANFPRQRAQLFESIRQTQARGVVFLSGDRHLAEISRLPVDTQTAANYPLYEITSSSLNTPSGNFTKAGTRFTNELNSHRLGLTYFETNFGLVDIDWKADDPVVRLQIRDESGAVVNQQRFRLSVLQPAASGDAQ